MSYSSIDHLLHQILRDEPPRTTYENIQRILLDNGIPFYVNKVIGRRGSDISSIQVFQCGINLEFKTEIIKKLLDGETCKVTASNEIITITA